MIRNYTKVSIINAFLSIYLITSLNHLQKLLLRKACNIFFGILACILFTSSFASAIDINSCTVINTPGTYTLTASISNSSATNCIEITSSNVTLDGDSYLIEGVDTSGTHGIHVYNPSITLSNVVIRNVRLKGWHVGIYFQEVDYSTIESSNISYNQETGAHLYGSDYNTVTNSTINSNWTFGILLNGGSNQNTISENTLNIQGQGIQVGLYPSTANHTIIRDNTIAYNNLGIDVYGSDFLTIEDNTLNSNEDGIYLDGTTDSTITRNRITDTSQFWYQNQYTGIRLISSQNNLIYDNFLDIYQNTAFGGTVYNNTWNIAKVGGTNIIGGPYLGGNYWGSFSGFGMGGPSETCADSDGDYICDDSYALEAGNVDNYPLKEFPDQDGDGVADPEDNCINISNPGQANSDIDDFGNACDNCWYEDNNDQTDTNVNCSGPPYTANPNCGDACEPSDTDGDGVPDVDDNCPLNPNPGQEDTEGDGVGNACDNCLNISNSDQNNWEGDGLGNACDNCWNVSNPDQADVDGDCSSYSEPYSIDPYCGDACDQCPNDPDKFFPRICGCGVPDTDSDNDGTPDCIDNCPNDRGKTEPGACGCGVPDSDEDNDGYLYCNDNCPNRANDQTDTDNDSLGDVCDNCPDVSNANQEDSDADFVGDVCDNCIDVPNRDQANSDGDAWGDVCDVDDDNDGILDESDNCPKTGNGLLAGTCVLDQHGKDCTRDWECGGGICSRNQEDTDGDGIGDACNDALDTDGDEWANSLDNCPGLFNDNQRDDNNNGLGDHCEFDLSIEKVEITQGIQDLNNSLPLVSGKETWLRVYLDVGFAQSPLTQVTGRLRFTNKDGQPIPTYGAGEPGACSVTTTQTCFSEWDCPGACSVTTTASCSSDGDCPVGETCVFVSAGETCVRSGQFLGFAYPDPLYITAEVTPDRGQLFHTLNFFIPGDWFWFEDPYIKIQVINEDPLHDEIDQGAFEGNNYYGPVPWEYDFAGERINIWFVPVEVNGCTPTRDEFYRAAEYVKRTYPIDYMNVCEDYVLKYDDDPTLHGDDMIWQLWKRDFRREAEPFDDMHYFGLVCDSDTIGATGSTHGTGGTSEIIDNNELAWGLMETSYPFGGATMAHELGHNYLSTFTGIGADHHVPGPGCGNPEGVNNSYPQYVDENGNTLHRASIGEHGFTLRLVHCSDSFFDTQTECLIAGETWDPNGYMGLKVYQPDRYRDVMSYCSNDERWISPYMYWALIYELGYMTIIGTSLDYNYTFQTTASESINQEYLITAGTIYDDGTVELKPFFSRMLAGGTDDEVGTGPYSIELLDRNGNTLFTRNFELDSSHAVNNGGMFIEMLPYHPSTSHIAIKQGTTVLELVTVSENMPEVTVTYPNGGEFLSGEQTITWSATDVDGDILYFDILYSSDDGIKWSAIATDIEGTSYVWDTERTAGSNSALIRIIVTDGVNTVQDDSDSTFIVDKKSPEPVIISPENDTSFFAGKMILFRGDAYDFEDGPLAGSALIWSSDKDGILGAGPMISLNNLSPGDHTITLSAIDSDGNQGTESIVIHISAIGDSDGDRIGDDVDNCPLNRNPDQADTDSDGTGDACDDDDSDGDGFPDSIDNCLSIPNDQTDIDGDGFGDVCDNPRYEIHSDSITDLDSGLVWQRSPRKETVDSWATAVAHCQGMNPSDEDGWHLPTVDEFNSLVDLSRSNPALPENHPFSNVNVDQGWYWSSTIDPANSNNAFYVDMSNGEAVSFDKSGYLGLAWCVRCQTWYEDADKDGFSNGNSIVQCDRPVDFYLSSELTTISGDCNDNNAAINQSVSEVCMDGVDNNCNGKVDYFDAACGGNIDDDNDGLSNGEETWFYKTSPDKPDTDDDGLDDGIEAAYWRENWNTDPDGDHIVNLLDPDSDNDGLNDGDEVKLLHTNPGLADTDGNGILDGDEDSDGDGFSNVEEIQHGSDPTDPNSRPIRAMPCIPLLLLSD